MCFRYAAKSEMLIQLVQFVYLTNSDHFKWNNLPKEKVAFPWHHHVTFIIEYSYEVEGILSWLLKQQQKKIFTLGLLLISVWERKQNVFLFFLIEKVFNHNIKSLNHHLCPFLVLIIQNCNQVFEYILRSQFICADREHTDLCDSFFLLAWLGPEMTQNLVINHIEIFSVFVMLHTHKAHPPTALVIN